MRRRRLICLGVVVLVLAGTLGRLGWFFLRTSPSRITKENLAKIHEGMTPDQVDAIMLGTQQFGMTPNPCKRYEGQIGYVDSLRVAPWTAEHTVILVTFDEDESSRRIVVTKAEMHVWKVLWRKRLTGWLGW